MPPAALLQKRRRLPPLLQRGAPLLLSKPHQQMGPRDPAALPRRSPGSGRHPAGPERRRASSDPPGAEPAAASELRGRPQAGTGARSGGLHRVLSADPEEPEGHV